MVRSPAGMSVVAGAVAGYFRLVRATSRFTYEPQPHGPEAEALWPYIAVGWHGDYFLLPALVDAGSRRFVALISRSADGELIARVVERFGHRAIRGSGANTPERMHEKRGVEAVHLLLDELAAGSSVVTSANFLRTADREVSRGIVMLARLSGRPIVPIAISTSRRLHVDSWDDAEINLPFSRGALIASDPVMVPADADGAAREEARLAVQAGINAAKKRADEIVHGSRG